ncbi:M20 family metallopeptidase [Natrialba swarupiae]|uniref:M20 family metallopeptidase n=1 Tax=Natrialba swarupiae TaxID=2448032 RepID=A0A5D5ANH1_9EURY|nr:M20 family metallopeptidase [Natrialba swarupiae]TYT62543.1 M20 family metallopeptidase [Natrialba swarupiae]
MTNETRERVTELLTSLISFETENPPGNEREAAEFIYDWFREEGIEPSLIDEPNAARPQVAVRVGEGDPTVVLNGHIDVVPAGDGDQWSYPPYEPTIEDDVLYGRGSADMKAGVAVAMLATVDIAAAVEAGELEGTVVFHAAMGEETAEPGTKTLLESGYTGDYGIVLEPTSLRTATSEKGLAWYEITVAGDPSHASRPDHGTNAIANVRPVLDALEAYDTDVRTREDDLLGCSYATVTEFEAGTKENVVPESATITVDRRFLPSETAGDVDSEIDELLATVEADHGIDTSWRRTRTYESAEIPVDSTLAEVVRNHSAAVADVPTDPWGIQASTDVRNLVNDAEMEAITWGPGELDQAHTYDEHIELPEVVAGYEVLWRVLEDLFEP